MKAPTTITITSFAAALLLTACSGSEPDAALPGNAQDDQPFAGIGPDEKVEMTGTEPFWNAEAVNGTLTYSTPEDMAGTTIAVTRFAGRGGLSFSGELDGKPLDVAVTPGTCSDGMSDRTYPLTVTLQLGDEQRNGCGWTDAQPFTDPVTGRE
ncbi:COG3650 family protein [Alteraurantiacibacter aquimixticola]|uniref:Lipoprotein n=1 Tax=Alteraurantiacibacter aquimixticola TaxID=2489173 RepID=A0A4T3F005_9SPHN|nr:hypothetical protein [Alteraurantiacibacter aquimixticola]TIX49754.1 hypothetical protein E5222_13155 [Alteraurantiacibacter aquimixticola]